MDYDWGKKDDNLGETIIDVDQLLAAGGRPVVLPLFRKQGLLGRGAYAQQMLRGMPSAVAVSATASPLPLTAVFPHGAPVRPSPGAPPTLPPEPPSARRNAAHLAFLPPSVPVQALRAPGSRAAPAGSAYRSTAR